MSGKTGMKRGGEEKNELREKDHDNPTIFFPSLDRE